MALAGDINVLFLGDVVGRAGRSVVKKLLPALKSQYDNCLVIANLENCSGGFGITTKAYDELIKSGVDIATGGNHIWDKLPVNADKFPMLVTPANLKGATRPILFIDYCSVPLAIINLAGTVFMPSDGAESPFLAFDRLYEDCQGRAVLLDFHAEATSEKRALAEYADGRAAAVIGTHTHVQTADERLLRNGTFFISDVGACLAYDSVLGMTIDSSLARFLSTKAGSRLTVEDNGQLMLCAVRLTISADTMKVTNFERIMLVG